MNDWTGEDSVQNSPNCCMINGCCICPWCHCPRLNLFSQQLTGNFDVGAAFSALQLRCAIIIWGRVFQYITNSFLVPPIVLDFDQVAMHKLQGQHTLTKFAGCLWRHMNFSCLLVTVIEMGAMLRKRGATYDNLLVATNSQGCNSCARYIYRCHTGVDQLLWPDRIYKNVDIV